VIESIDDIFIQAEYDLVTCYENALSLVEHNYMAAIGMSESGEGFWKDVMNIV
jgi:hypothetical protein